MKKAYLFASIVGFIVPNILVFQESIETGNYLLYTNSIATFSGMFANRISTIFILDLLLAVVVFFLWSYRESKRLNIKQVYWVWLTTMLLGLGGGFPLFLYFREKSLEKQA